MSVVGHVVQFVVNGNVVFWGTAKYVTADGWVGIEDQYGRVDEAPVALVEVDPT
jgi:hypothetical protein